MFRNFKHKPVQVSAVEVTAEYVRALDPEGGPILPQFNSRTGEPQAVEWEDGYKSAGIGDFIIATSSGGYRAIGGDAFKAKYDPAW